MRGFAVAAVVSLCAATARAEDPVVPPRVTEQAEPRYPEGAEGDASVLLELVVEETGALGEVKVIEGEGAFAQAAVDAVRNYRFVPATRGGKPVRARIRMLVAFTQPEAVTKAPPPPEEVPVAPPPAPPRRVEEVTIAGQKPIAHSVTEQKIGRADVRLLPGAFGDPYRAIEMLPGVIPTVSGLPYYYIRGSPPSAVGYYVDEVRVPYLFHFALGPGVIQPSLIEEVALHPASYPGRFGRYAGAIVTGRTREPGNEWRGEGQIRVFDAGAFVEAPFANGRATAGVGGRYSYTAGVFSLFAKDTTVDYRDYNARFSYAIDDRTRVTAFTFGAYDFASQIERDNGVEEENVLFASEFHRLDVRLDHRGRNGSLSRVATTFGIDRTRLEGARFAQDFLVSVRGWHRTPVRADMDVELGIDTQLDHYTGDLPSPYASFPEEYQAAVNFFSPRNDTATGAWVSGTWHPSGFGVKDSKKGFELTATMRADVFTSDGEARVGPSPRTSMRLPLLGEKLAFLGAVGVAPQPPVFAIPIPAVGYRGLPGGIAFGYQKSGGFEAELPLKFAARAVYFHHTYVNLRDIARGGTNSIDLEEVDAPPDSPAWAQGLELHVSRKLSERIGGFMSYTLSRSVIGSTAVRKERVSPVDRTHVFQIGASADLGRGYRVGARFLTYRGWPDEGTELLSNTEPEERLRPFVRLDARFEKRWDWRKNGHISFIVEVLNATATKEVIGRDCDSPFQGCRDDAIGPITVPSIGVEGAL